MFVWPSVLFFSVSIFFSVLRLWFILRRFQIDFLNVGLSTIFALVIGVFTQSLWASELIKWILLGILFSSFSFPVFLSLLYSRMFDFLLLSIVFVLFSQQLPDIWVIVLGCIGFAVCGLGIFISLLVLKRYTSLSYLKTKSMSRLSFGNFKTIRKVGLFTGCIWLFDSLALYFLFKAEKVPFISDAVLQGLVSHVNGFFSFIYNLDNHTLNKINNMQYISFDIPLFIFAFFISIFALRRLNQKNQDTEIEF